MKYVKPLVSVDSRFPCPIPGSQRTDVLVQVGGHVRGPCGLLYPPCTLPYPETSSRRNLSNGSSTFCYCSCVLLPAVVSPGSPSLRRPRPRPRSPRFLPGRCPLSQILASSPIHPSIHPFFLLSPLHDLFRQPQFGRPCAFAGSRNPSTLTHKLDLY